MDSIYLIVLGILAGISAGIGVLFLFIGLRRSSQTPLHISFGVFALSYAGAIAAGALVYRSDSVENYLAYSRLSGIFVITTFVALLFFVATYTQIRPRLFLGGLTAVFLILLVPVLFSPTFIFEEIGELVFITLPWGETVTQVDAIGSIWEIVFFAAELVAIGYLLYAGLRQYRRGERQEATALLAGLAVFIFTLLYDSFLVDTGVLNFIYLGDFGFLPLAILMGLQLAENVIDTEEELEDYKAHLENLVEERTTELRRSESRARALLDSPPDSATLISPEGKVLDINQVGADRFGFSREQMRGQDAFELFDPELAQFRKRKIQEVLDTKSPLVWEDKRTNRDLENRLFPILDESEEVAAIAVYSADITERKRNENLLRQQASDLQALNRVAGILSKAIELDQGIDQVSQLVNELFEAQYSHIILLQKDSPNHAILRGYDIQSGQLESQEVGYSLYELEPSRQAVITGEPLLISNISDISMPVEVANFLAENQINSLILIPLLVRSTVLGLLVINRSAGSGAFTPQDLELAETIGGYIAGAVENARLLEQTRVAGAEEERSRLARELHDSVTQTLYSVSILAEALPRLVERDPKQAQSSALHLRRVVLGALAEMRTLLFELRPKALEAANIETLLSQQADALTGRTRIPVDVVIEPEVELPGEVKISLFRITQEAMNNIAKHSQATQANVTLTHGENGIFLEIGDNGCGFDPTQIHGENMGLRIMQERAAEIGAALNIHSVPDTGTQISVSWKEKQNG